MKKFFVMAFGLAAVLAMSSCKSSESAYKKSYEEAQKQVVTDQEPQSTTTESQVEVIPMTPSTGSSDYADASNVRMQSESVTVVSGNGLKAYSVICGSFSLKTNAEGLQRTLTNAGYNAQIAYNQEKNMYRVVASTFDDKESAIQSRNTLRGTYPDAWLLLSK